MKCVKHPSEKATTVCSTCGNALCQACTLTLEDNSVICSQCKAAMGATGLVDIETKLQEQIDQEARKEREARKKQKKKSLLIAFSIMALLAVALSTTIFFKQQEISEFRELTPFNDLLFTATEIDSAIQDYMETHEGNVPESLDDLSQSEAFQEASPVDLDKIIYHQLSPNRYKLLVKDVDDQLIYFSGEDE